MNRRHKKVGKTGLRTRFFLFNFCTRGTDLLLIRIRTAVRSRLPSSFDGNSHARSDGYCTTLDAHCLAENASLVFANLMTLVTASSDLTSLEPF